VRDAGVAGFGTGERKIPQKRQDLRKTEFSASDHAAILAEVVSSKTFAAKPKRKVEEAVVRLRRRPSKIEWPRFGFHQRGAC
jgi:hypothetical protein